ncbi:MAG: LysE family transporter [Chloroflexi bacterium]|nr:LysE family transporter [Chloroflexota bacterium]
MLQMLPLLTSVVVISLSGVMLPGPMFAVTLAKSYRSPWAGTWISLGHAVIEVPLIMLVYFGFARFFQEDLVRLVLSVAGGGMILWLGVSLLRSRAPTGQEARDLPGSAFVSGILTSAFNPAFLLWWATIGSLLVMKFLDFGLYGLAALIVVHWLCDLTWLSLVSQVVNRTQSLWQPRFKGWLFTGCGLLLAGFGLWFIVSGVMAM